MTSSRNREAPVAAETGPADGVRGAPRTLAEELRTRPDGALTVLLRARPDLLSPVPNDLTQLATRAGTRASVVRAVERLDRFALQTAEALAVAPDPCPYETLRDLMTGTAEEPGGEPGPSAEAPLPAESRAHIADALPRAVATLRDQALVWGGDDRLRLVRTARELLSPSPGTPSPTGLGPTVHEAASGMSPGRLQELLAAAGLPPTHDPVTAVAALAELFGDRARMALLLAGAPEGAHAVLAKLVWGPAYGEVSVASPTPPVAWLLERGLLLPSGPRNVVLPREVALRLRAGRAHRAPEPLPPPLTPAAEHRPQAVDSTAAGQAFTALATVEELMGQWESAPPQVLRAGGLSVRDLKRTAAALDVTERIAAFWIELAYAAGLLASDGETDERYAPTPGYDDWLRLAPEERWAGLVSAWLAATRTAGLVGARDAKGRTLAALGPELDRSPAPEVRRRLLTLLATLPAGVSAGADGLLTRLRWERPPHRGAGPAVPAPASPTGAVSAAVSASAAGSVSASAAGSGSVPGSGEDLRSRLARWALAEAELLGITGRAALSSHGRVLLGLPPDGPAPSSGPEATAGRPTTPAEASIATANAARLLAPLLPEPLDHVLLQADLTAVAPGPLQRPLAETLGVLAEVESKGGATVYRFTPASVRRALDAGRSADDLHTFLTAHSRTPVPQPLAYLIDDVARKHGHLRIGAASAYLRCDDDALLAEILADRRSAALRLRRLAPTVLASQTPPDALLDGLRAMGYAPAAESAEGDVLITRAEARRTLPRTAPTPVPDGPPRPDDTLLGAAVRAIRAGDLAATTPHKPVPAAAGADTGGAAAATGPSGRLPRTTSADTLATMQAAALTGSAVWIGYVNADGAASQRVIAPVRVEGGFVTAYDHTADEVRTYPLHRITGVAELADEAG
ncbi:helicase C-terminal domain-containing protein [Streptomyces sp. NPDC048636]|uniref:helicase C-terminal domain-containing protein n=1 Tax=Streptomyces sp. NPDC048636 TaxID=3155762 RepID=UPI0034289AED